LAVVPESNLKSKHTQNRFIHEPIGGWVPPKKYRDAAPSGHGGVLPNNHTDEREKRMSGGAALHTRNDERREQTGTGGDGNCSCETWGCTDPRREHEREPREGARVSLDRSGLHRSVLERSALGR